MDRVYGHGISYCITVSTKESDQELHPKSSYYVFSEKAKNKYSFGSIIMCGNGWMIGFFFVLLS